MLSGHVPVIAAVADYGVFTTKLGIHRGDNPSQVPVRPLDCSLVARRGSGNIFVLVTGRRHDSGAMLIEQHHDNLGPDEEGEGGEELKRRCR